MVIQTISPFEGHVHDYFSLLQERMIQESFYGVLLSYSSISSTKISNRVLAIVIIDQVCYRELRDYSCERFLCSVERF